jgi:hypothetical protein
VRQIYHFLIIIPSGPASIIIDISISRLRKVNERAHSMLVDARPPARIVSSICFDFSFCTCISLALGFASTFEYDGGHGRNDGNREGGRFPATNFCTAFITVPILGLEFGFHFDVLF